MSSFHNPHDLLLLLPLQKSRSCPKNNYQLSKPNNISANKKNNNNKSYHQQQQHLIQQTQLQQQQQLILWFLVVVPLLISTKPIKATSTTPTATTTTNRKANKKIANPPSGIQEKTEEPAFGAEVLSAVKTTTKTTTTKKKNTSTITTTTYTKAALTEEESIKELFPSIPYLEGPSIHPNHHKEEPHYILYVLDEKQEEGNFPSFSDLNQKLPQTIQILVVLHLFKALLSSRRLAEGVVGGGVSSSLDHHCCCCSSSLLSSSRWSNLELKPLQSSSAALQLQQEPPFTSKLSSFRYHPFGVVIVKSTLYPQGFCINHHSRHHHQHPHQHRNHSGCQHQHSFHCPHTLRRHQRQGYSSSRILEV